MALKLLIAEDNGPLYRAINRTIRRQIPGTELTHVTSGHELMAELDKILREEAKSGDMYHGIISDNDMGPGPSGLDCLKYAKEIGINQAYFMMSARDIRSEAMNLGAVEFFDKPEGILEIGERFKEYFSKHI